MKRECAFFAVVFLMSMGVGLGRAQTPVDKPVFRLDPALDSIISPDAKVEVVKSGFNFTEGQIWVQHGKEGYLLFTDIPGNAIYKLIPDKNELSVFLDHAGYDGPMTGYEMLTIGSIKNNRLEPTDPLYREFSNAGPDGLGMDPQGRVIVCTYVGRSMIRIEKDGKRTLLADRWNGKRFDGTNDVAVRRDGTIYFTDTTSGMRLYENDPSREMDSMGIYMIKDGKVTRILENLAYANGLAFSPDEKYLYANNTGKSGQISRYEVQPDGTVNKNAQLIIDVNKVHKQEGTPTVRWGGGPDGLRVDSKGNLYSTGPNGVWIISPEGKHLGTILTPESVANFAFGDADYKTLYLGGKTSIYKIRVITPGIPCNSCTSN
jgi:gluconolactonase